MSARRCGIGPGAWSPSRISILWPSGSRFPRVRPNIPGPNPFLRERYLSPQAPRRGDVQSRACSASPCRSSFRPTGLPTSAPLRGTHAVSPFGASLLTSQPRSTALSSGARDSRRHHAARMNHLPIERGFIHPRRIMPTGGLLRAAAYGGHTPWGRIFPKRAPPGSVPEITGIHRMAQPWQERSAVRRNNRKRTGHIA